MQVVGSTASGPIRCLSVVARFDLLVALRVKRAVRLRQREVGGVDLVG